MSVNHYFTKNEAFQLSSIDALKIVDSSFKPTGYVFKNWIDENQTTYNDKEVVTFNTDNKTLCATWDFKSSEQNNDEQITDQDISLSEYFPEYFPPFKKRYKITNELSNNCTISNPATYVYSGEDYECTITTTNTETMSYHFLDGKATIYIGNKYYDTVFENYIYDEENMIPKHILSINIPGSDLTNVVYIKGKMQPRRYAYLLELKSSMFDDDICPPFTDRIHLSRYDTTDTQTSDEYELYNKFTSPPISWTANPQTSCYNPFYWTDQPVNGNRYEIGDSLLLDNDKTLYLQWRHGYDLSDCYIDYILSATYFRFLESGSLNEKINNLLSNLHELLLVPRLKGDSLSRLMNPNILQNPDPNYISIDVDYNSLSAAVDSVFTNPSCVKAVIKPKATNTGAILASSYELSLMIPQSFYCNLLYVVDKTYFANEPLGTIITNASGNNGYCYISKPVSASVYYRYPTRGSSALIIGQQAWSQKQYVDLSSEYFNISCIPSSGYSVEGIYINQTSFSPQISELQKISDISSASLQLSQPTYSAYCIHGYINLIPTSQEAINKRNEISSLFKTDNRYKYFDYPWDY